eukprot:g14302.t1
MASSFVSPTLREFTTQCGAGGTQQGQAASEEHESRRFRGRGPFFDKAIFFCTDPSFLLSLAPAVLPDGETLQLAAKRFVWLPYSASSLFAIRQTKVVSWPDLQMGRGLVRNLGATQPLMERGHCDLSEDVSKTKELVTEARE